MRASNPVSEHLRTEVGNVAADWEAAIERRLPLLGRLGRDALIDHLPEFLFGLAAWVEGDEQAARSGFEALVQGHALQRLGHGVDLETLSVEYQVLRTVILVRLLAVESTQAVREALVRLNEGLDHAISAAIHSYTSRRDEVRERFVGILGHDLRNPLHAISLAAAQLVEARCGETRHSRLAGTIQRSAARMMRMISDVIDFAHAHLGQGIPAVPRPCVMGEVCEEAVAELRLAHPDRDLRVELSGDTSGHWDRDRLMQVVSNLVGNALQHGRDPIVVSAREAPDREAVILRIENRGEPIRPQQLRRLFDPFRHGHGDATRPRTSLGLGLYIVEQIAISHGATIDVSSDERATVFELRWPRVPSELTPERDRPA